MKRCRRMSVIQVILSIIYVILGVAISIVILMQEGKSNGLGSAIGGISTDSYWSKNRGRSMEGALEHFTRYGAIVFMIITIILNILLRIAG
jgi:preprotein translocase subunit SecG